jgi:hypothetical protein
VALKDFYITWFNSLENMADIEASFRNITNSGCPSMHAMVVAWCTKPQGCVATVAAVSFRVEKHFCLLEYLLVSDQLYTQKHFGKKADESPLRMLDLANYFWRSPILWNVLVLLPPLQLMPVPLLQLGCPQLSQRFSVWSFLVEAPL